jgi:hypothetical protein
LLKIIVLGFLVCVGGAVAFAVYAAWRITKIGQSMGRGGTTVGNTYYPSDYITTTGTTIHDQNASTMESGSAPMSGSTIGDSIGESVGESISDFGSGDAGDSGSSDSGGGDSGGSDSGGSSD